jgi:hypothetical protein
MTGERLTAGWKDEIFLELDSRWGWSVVAGCLFGLCASAVFLAGSYNDKVSVAEFRGTPLAKSARYRHRRRACA